MNDLKAIKTIDELLWAQQHDPELVNQCFQQVTVLEDLRRYLRWLHESQSDVTVVSKLKRQQGRALGIHPSSVAKKGVCPLKLYYECTGELAPDRAYDEQAQQTWDIGSLLHDLHQAHFREMYGPQFQDEVKLKMPEIHLTSSADGLFDFELVRIVLEMKSIKEGGNFGWEKVQTKPLEDNVRQTHCYMRAANVPFGIVFYMCKNNGGIKEHPIMFNPEVWSDINSVIQPVISAAYQKGPKVRGSVGWHCKQCSYHRACPAVREENSYAKGASRSWKRP